MGGVHAGAFEQRHRIHTTVTVVQCAPDGSARPRDAQARLATAAAHPRREGRWRRRGVHHSCLPPSTISSAAPLMISTTRLASAGVHGWARSACLSVCMASRIAMGAAMRA